MFTRTTDDRATSQKAFQQRHLWMTGVRACMSREDIVLMMYLGDARAVQSRTCCTFYFSPLPLKLEPEIPSFLSTLLLRGKKAHVGSTVLHYSEHRQLATRKKESDSAEALLVTAKEHLGPALAGTLPEGRRFGASKGVRLHSVFRFCSKVWVFSWASRYLLRVYEQICTTVIIIIITTIVIVIVSIILLLIMETPNAGPQTPRQRWIRALPQMGLTVQADGFVCTSGLAFFPRCRPGRSAWSISMLFDERIWSGVGTFESFSFRSSPVASALGAGGIQSLIPSPV